MIGPTLPPHLSQKSAENEENGPEVDQDEEEDTYGPTLPPALAARRAVATAPGPVAPPVVPKQVEQYENDEDDDDIGPKLPSASTSKQDAEDGVREFLEREERRRELAKEEAKPKAMKREEWMLAPPTASEALQSLDPTRIKNRQFSKATGRDEVSKDTSLWTETPAERQARLAEELSGKRKRPNAAVPDEGDEIAQKRRKIQQELRREIDDHNKVARPQSLFEMHQAAQANQPDKEENNAIWDRDRDMGSGGRLMDQSKRSKLIQDAKSLGDRFGSSKRGAYN
ncbi:hypothetical protein M408DRAFT_62041 [Serendipita vermifera MAFF 305830]|uniref:DUF3752 domain-containing protein n=1 Tax=Serendipita vermifera MAFF 305830 TaxID=933852 RepID=A0A0C3BMG1_SERVB|nr:hypothetical protein M408DRAFT_62041 [Serendipita vermifera MAFF 305830]